MKKPTRSAAESIRYRAFVNDRNRALEVLLVRAQAEVGDLMRHFLSRVAGIVSMHALHGDRVGTNALTASVQSSIEREMPGTTAAVLRVVQKMRRNTWLLAHVGEAEAIGRALGPEAGTKYEAGYKQLLMVQADPNPAGGGWGPRIELALQRITLDVVEAVRLSRVLDESDQEMLQRVRAKLPKSKQHAAPARVLRKVQEASKDKIVSVDVAAGAVDSAAWDAMYADYMNEYVPQWRGPETVFDLDIDREPLPRGGHQALGTGEEADASEWYGWEIEQQMTEDFVGQVRSGQVAAANENGISDFIWIAIIDGLVCTDCCRWRNGLTTSEIEAELQKGKHAGDECRETVPPAHFNCRCDLSPLLEGMPDEPPPDFGEFYEWMNR